MDIPVYLTLALIGGGYYLNPKRRDPNRAQLNIGDSLGQYLQPSSYQQKINNMTKKVVEPSSDYDSLATQVIPFYFNNLQESKLKKLPNPDYQPKLFQQLLAEKGIQATELQIASETGTEAKFWDEFGIRGNNSKSSAGQGAPLITKTDLPSSGAVPMTHNNMVPFHSGDTKQFTPIDGDNRHLEGKLEAYTGQFKLDKAHKTEVSPLFAPVPQAEAVASLTAPRHLDRFTTNLDNRHNELPFEQTRVGPGLAGGFTAMPSGGFHNPVRILPKNIDQLVVNPRTVNEGRIIRGKHIDKRTAQMNSFKYRPELLVTNFNGERNFTTVGAYTKPKVRSKLMMLPTERQRLNRGIVGAAKYARTEWHTPVSLLPNAKLSDKVTFKNTPYRNAQQNDGKKHHNEIQSSYENKRNERSVTGPRYGGEDTSEPIQIAGSSQGTQTSTESQKSVIEHFQAGSKIAGLNTGHSMINPQSQRVRPIAGFLDKARSTRKEAYIYAQNQFGHAQISEKKQRVYDPDDQARTTHRETTENLDWYSSPNANYLQSGKGYQVTNTDIQRNTNRQFTTDWEYTGNANQAESGQNPKSYHDAYNMRQNLNKEVVAEGRMPTLSGTKINLGKHNVNINIKKLDQDRNRQYSLVPNPTFPATRKPISDLEITSFKNTLPPYNPRFDPSVLETFNRNPLSQSLQSYA